MAFLEETAKEIRKDIVKMIGKASSGHPGGSLSSVEILTLLYFEQMKVDEKNPKDDNRDRFVLSKGHAAPVLYATLAQKGFFAKAELENLRQLGSMLQGHPDMKKVPGVDMSTGSLGQGISAAVGMALAGKMDDKTHKVYALLGDGELQEGLVWEAVMAASHYRLNNLIAFVDNNNLQTDGAICDVMSPFPIDDKFSAFGWNVITVEDGHSFDELRIAVEAAKKSEDRPTVIICKTVKGKCVSFMENNAGWHGKGPNAEEVKQALAELEA
ncbi:transketolase [Acetobacterium woodii]|uniref:Transketolase subunit A n=1 Tax=Acetobacterium woodii (strain ATCC 29683 / DSM 1030 / JCM 2381 / KCTC 1655 / WB1) TaxID=931626 RepID=H6LH34_ACEWD|nr:1-deoxy-D-xylulose-5-phosphate synthase N-terminal domain-containing protein [Acetobacterium woodii]AFA47172.1 transketolase subunit A [Acetobacterium woodii DSM 1030]